MEDTVLVEPPSCGTDEVELLVFVMSAPGHEAARQTIRNTWGGKLHKSSNVRVLYILGREAAVSGDILVEDFQDTYLNLTLKSTFMLKWITRHCSQTKFVFKIDDDVFVNAEKLWETLESTQLYFKSIPIKGLDGEFKSKGTDYALIGHVMNTVPIRDPTSKWYLPPKFYPLNIFPTFLSGTGYIFSGSLATPLYLCALKTPFINLEDVFITGLCATTQLGLRLTHNPGFQWRPMTVGGTHTCNYKQSVLVHGSFQPDTIQDIFSKAQDDLLCDTILFHLLSSLSTLTDFFRNIFRI
ncbi:beta-1,3-galactosyltransferase 1 [Eurytemora carolleeae]|uniref:beta-1,3-galactosyltransferase 1 n=1 Tax=Eurytemora carolleeae TaxID=1294199 RepID=UPI000C78CE0E|nr:beta-1,3-galactosyltransferase 1 [Eurytemora carolleeae]|eukprot:XP_023340907.1 beta-1,3-galactosyltransferase 1-like [Eurytemora affinis]